MSEDKKGVHTYKRKVSNYIVDPRFQIKYTALLVATAVALLALLGHLYLSETKALNRVIGLRSLDLRFDDEMEEQLDSMLGIKGIREEPASGDEENPDAERCAPTSDPQFDAQLQAAIEEAENWRTPLIFVTAGLLVLFLAAVGVVMTHRVAGPMQALKSNMGAVERGDWNAVRPFRRKDEFQALSARFRAMADVLQAKERKEIESLEAMRRLAAGRGDMEGLIDAMVREKTKFLGGPGL